MLINKLYFFICAANRNKLGCAEPSSAAAHLVSVLQLAGLKLAQGPLVPCNQSAVC